MTRRLAGALTTLAARMAPGNLPRPMDVFADKLLGYLASVLPVDGPDFQIHFVLDRAEWLRDCAAILLTEADQF